MIQAVLFDLDGTLIDSELVYYEAYRTVLASHGHDFPLAEYLRAYSGRPIRTIIADFIEVYGLTLTVDEGTALVEEAELAARAAGVPLKPGAIELLDHLRSHGYRTAIATSSRKDRALDILESHGIARDFDAGVFSDDIRRGKPDPEVFLLAASRLGAPPEECLVLEDSTMGIEAARAGGFPVVCLPDKTTPDEAHRAMTAAVLGSLDEVIGLLDADRASARTGDREQPLP
ncbi:HAD family phosphatase [Actinomyces sp. B33]|uniref:HAD family hydrolase n=1 Tax=Actinomyces sp. B33 TaxID=2942131 RepID=UPI002340BFEA|nr:HAD family phosphatase [Actinomyces sp. B33]MDC4233733.1 HAD family phosphatase [Actinomyces sp. B33]